MTEPDAVMAPSAGPVTPPVAPEALADLGILLVHGIGDQAQGETLTQMTEPMIAWIRQWLRTEAPAGSLIATAAVSAALRPPLLDASTPAHAYVHLGRSGRVIPSGPTEAWLFAEAWWAPQVLAPPLGRFTGWLVISAPWVMLFHFSQRWLPHQMGGWRQPLRMALITPLWLMWSLVVSASFVVLYPLALVPVGRLRDVVSAALRRISGVLGDAYVKILHPLQRRAMEDATIAAMRWLAPRCRRLVVIAHSQGAAVAHGALGRGDAPRADLFVTVGAGMAKLSALRYFQDLGASDRLAPVLSPLFTLATAIVTLRLQQPGVEWMWLPPATLGILAIAFVITAWISVDHARADLKRPELPVALASDRVGRWCDIVATHDPVPAGNITKFFNLPDVHHEEVEILGSVLEDHTSYWSAGTTFMPVLVEQLIACSESKVVVIDETDQRFATATAVLHRDLRILGMTRYVDGLAVILPLAAATDRVVNGVAATRQFLSGGRVGVRAPLAFVDTWLTTISEWLRWLAPISATTADATVNWSAAAAFLGLLWFAWRRVLFGMWSAWSGNRIAEAFRRVDVRQQPATPKPSERLASLMVPVVVHGLFLLVVAAPIATASLWTYAPGRMTEAGLYWTIGLVLPAIFVGMVAIAFAGAAADEAVEVGRELSATSVRRLGWPTVRDAGSRICAALLALGVALLIIGTTFDVGRGIRDVVPSAMGVGLYAAGLLFVLDHIWQQLRSAPPSLRTALMVCPPAIGVALALTFHDREVLAMFAVAGGMSVLSAGLLWLVLRVVVGPTQVDTTKDDAS